MPIRFLQACPRGHVSDINWKIFVHGQDDSCSRPLWLEERGTSGDLAEVFIRCECGKARQLSVATKLNDAPLGYCKGHRPWLGPKASERCGGQEGSGQPNRLLVRAASNAYFAQTLSVISIPETGAKVRAAVDEVWEDFLQYADSLEDVVRDRRRQKVSAALEGLSSEEVWQEVQRRKGGPALTTVGIREAEIKTLLSSPDTAGTDQPDGLFYARTIDIPGGETALTSKLSCVVKVHRLREVIAQVGFTRFEAAVPDVNGELALDVERAVLSLDQDWLPAVENRGEGLFVGVDTQAVKAWFERVAVKKRTAQLLEGFLAWQKANQGILLYTASPDAEGTLGGLVEAADRIDRYLRQAIELGQLCSNDPVCAQHQPDAWQEDRFLHGAACHGCLLLAESSCERRNDFLDRALVVPTVDGDGAAFFEGA